MAKLIDLQGSRFSHLVVIERAGSDKHGHAVWLCQCDCGNQKVIEGHKLIGGNYKSCGCMHNKYSHGQYNTRLYHIWLTMKARCLNPNSHKYYAYGGRGISIIEEWISDFQVFYDWSMKNGYRSNLTLDRKDNDGNYCPENCRWTTPKEQANNTRHNHNIEYNGETHTIAEWAEIKGLTKNALYHRLSRGWSISDALSIPQKYGR